MTLVGGREIAHHGLPVVDQLTVSGAGRRWIDQQWLAQWTFYQAWNAGGYAAVALLGSLLVAAAFGILALVLSERGAQPRRVAKWTVLAFATSLPDMAIRAQDFAYPLFALLGWLILRDLEQRPSRRRLAAAVLLLVAWANLHGSVLLGSLLFALYCGWRALKTWREPNRNPAIYLLAAVAAVAAPVATPYGVQTVRYYAAVFGNPAIRRFASEWKPATPTTIAAIGFFALVAALSYVLLVGLRRGVQPPKPLLMVTAALVAAGFVELRWETWAAFPAVVLAVETLNASDPSRRPRRPVKQRWVEGGIGLLALAGIVLLLSQRSSQFEREAPPGAIAAAVHYADAHPGVTVLGDDRSSDALLWKHAELSGRVGLDDRLEVFSPLAVRDWVDYIRGRGSVARITSGYDLLLASRENTALAKRLLTLSGWHVLYRGSDGVAVVRD